jgi:predicted O-methyltransferase YrrM
MSKLRAGLNLLNKFLCGVNLRVETLTLDRLEEERLRAVQQAGWFDRAVYSVPRGFLKSSHAAILEELPKHQQRFTSFQQATANDVGYDLNNGFYTSPDAEVLYAVVRMNRPRRIVEIGCGNSTKIIRQALKDGGLSCEHVAIDPQPREEISRLVDVMIRGPIEYADAGSRVEALGTGDILFIDTSHEVKPANDVAYIYGQLLDKVAPGVIVHIHDIFLPYEYPRSWVMDIGLKWGEQYLVHAILANPTSWEVLWPGYYLQRTLPDFAQHFPHNRGGAAQSLWLRKTS